MKNDSHIKPTGIYTYKSNIPVAQNGKVPLMNILCMVGIDMYTKLAFSSSDELIDIGRGVPVAQETPLFYRSPEGDLVEIEDRGIVLGERYISTVSKGYSVFQNQTMIQTVSDVIEDLDLDVRGSVLDLGRRIHLELYFPDMVVEEIDHNKPIYLGAKLVNSYDRTTSFRGTGYMHRMWCENGAYATHILPSMRFNQIHVGDKVGADKTLSLYLSNIGKYHSDVKAVIETAKDYLVYFDDPNQILVSIGQWVASRKMGENIYSYLMKEVNADETEISRYDIWNAFTAFATHHPNISHNIRDRVSRIAEYVLFPQSDVTPTEDWEKHLPEKKVIEAEVKVVA